ncbi:putative porin [Paraburkholderia sp. BL27I4N3]|uniref:porin n=1 Tax=Paraburkholderia sp. BL27I4N3 TaxID=1938805 RepID=UPI000E37045A|nr:porin [Paraburkholderia sp. BL27I4N3]REE07444.1 putative porin [Paraburkholderia sp. BL27I4N3]
MRTKCYVVFIISVSVSNCVLAQSTQAVSPDSAVTMYGNIDIGPTYVSNSNGKSKVIMDSSVYRSDHFGFLGREYLGGGLSSIFRIETEFFANNGSFQGGTGGFTSQVYVGLSSNSKGTVTMGRQVGLMSELVCFSSACQGDAYSFHHGSTDQIGGPEVNNSIRYEGPYWAGFRIKYQYGFTDTTNKLGHTSQGAIVYQRGNLKAAVVLQQSAAAPVNPGLQYGVSRFFGLPVNQTSGAIYLDRLTIGGIGSAYTAGPIRIVGDITDSKMKKGNNVASLVTYDGGFVYSFNAFNSLGFSVQRTSLGGAVWTQYTIGEVYLLSKRTMLTATIAYQRASGTAQNAVMPIVGNSSSKTQIVPHIGINVYF